MTLNKHYAAAQKIMQVLKLRYILFPIANTDHGQLYMKYYAKGDGFELVLDAVPLNLKDFDVKQLKKLIEKEFFTVK